jgi:ribonuclease P protein component
MMARQCSSDGGVGGERDLPSDQRLRRYERIKDEYEYREVISKGKLLVSKAFKAYFLVGCAGRRKAGFIAGRRVGGACDRNRAKRLLKEVAGDDFRVAFIAGPAMKEAEAEEVRLEMEAMFAQCGLLKEDDG